MQTSEEDQRWNFAMASLAGQRSGTELCERYGVSRPTRWKGLRRAAEDAPGFLDRSRAPARGPHERMHEALDGDLPSDRWEPSPRQYAERLRPPEYPGHLEVRRVNGTGHFRLEEREVFLGHALANEPIGLEPADFRKR